MKMNSQWLVCVGNFYFYFLTPCACSKNLAAWSILQTYGACLLEKPQWCVPPEKSPMVVCLYYLQENLQLCLPEKNPPIQRVLCALPKDKTPLLIIVCCWILLEESSFQKHPECPFDQPSKILQSSLTEYLIPYFTLAFCHIYSERQVEHPSKNSTNCDSECMVGMPPFPLAVCWPCSYMQHVSMFTW